MPEPPDDELPDDEPPPDADGAGLACGVGAAGVLEPDAEVPPDVAAVEDDGDVVFGFDEGLVDLAGLWWGFTCRWWAGVVTVLVVCVLTELVFGVELPQPASMTATAMLAIRGPFLIVASL